MFVTATDLYYLRIKKNIKENKDKLIQYIDGNDIIQIKKIIKNISLYINIFDFTTKYKNFYLTKYFIKIGFTNIYGGLKIAIKYNDDIFIKLYLSNIEKINWHIIFKYAVQFKNYEILEFANKKILDSTMTTNK